MSPTDTPINRKRLRQFLRDVRGVSKSHTQKRYWRWLDRWEWWLDRQGLAWADVDHYDCAEFLDLLRAERPWSSPRYRMVPYSASSISGAVAVLRTIYDFLVLEKVVGANPWALIRTKDRKPRIPTTLTEDEMRRLIKAAGYISEHDTEARVTRAVRDSAILWTLYSTGLRVSELCSLDVSDVDFEREQVLVRQGKGDKQRIALVTAKALREIEEWLRWYRGRYLNGTTEQALFLQRSGERIHRNRVAEIVSTCAKRARITKRVTPHVIRHTFATHLVENGAPLEAVQELLGHESLRSTEIYLHVSREHVRKHYLLAHPLAGNS